MELKFWFACPASFLTAKHDLMIKRAGQKTLWGVLPGELRIIFVNVYSLHILWIYVGIDMRVKY